MLLHYNSRAKYYAFTITIPEACILRLRLQGAISRIRSVVSQVRPEHGSNSAQQRDSSASAMPSSAEPQDWDLWPQLFLQISSRRYYILRTPFFCYYSRWPRMLWLANRDFVAQFCFGRPVAQSTEAVWSCTVDRARRPTFFGLVLAPLTWLVNCAFVARGNFWFSSSAVVLIWVERKVKYFTYLSTCFVFYVVCR